jgi:hypothetical protein
MADMVVEARIEGHLFTMIQQELLKLSDDYTLSADEVVVHTGSVYQRGGEQRSIAGAMDVGAGSCLGRGSSVEAQFSFGHQ